MSSTHDVPRRPEPTLDPPATAPLVGTLHIHVAFDVGSEVYLDRTGSSCRPIRKAYRAGRAPRRRVHVSSPRRCGFASSRRRCDWRSSAKRKRRSMPRYSISARSRWPCACLSSCRPRRVCAWLVGWRSRRKSSAPRVRHSRHCSIACCQRFIRLAGTTSPRSILSFSCPPTARCRRRRRELLAQHGAWLAGLVRLEDEPLSREEIDEALRILGHRLSARAISSCRNGRPPCSSIRSAARRCRRSNLPICNCSSFASSTSGSTND